MTPLQIAGCTAFAVMTIVGFVLMLVDKRRAEQNKWRIKEATLFTAAFFLGGVGATLGMFAFRHKTKHWYFRLGLPFLAILNVAVIVLLFVL